MKFMIFIFIFSCLIITTNELIFEKVSNSKFSNAELINNNILISYNGGMKKFTYDFNLISQIDINELILDSYSDIHQINTN